jgi:hypothetical protein
MPAFLENIVADALQNVLGAFFIGIKSERLKVDVFSGQVVLRNLLVREDALSFWQVWPAPKRARLRRLTA